MDTNKHKQTKPALTSTRSLDEGFESDPERFSSSGSSTDDHSFTSTSTGTFTQHPFGSDRRRASHIQHSHHLHQQAPSPNPFAFNVLQHTDRDGVQHTEIARHQTTQRHTGRHHWSAAAGSMVAKLLPRPQVTTITSSASKSSSPASIPSTASQMPTIDYRRRVGPKSTLTTASSITVGAAGIMRSQSVDAVRPIQLPKVKMDYKSAGKYGRSMSGNNSSSVGGSPNSNLSNGQLLQNHQQQQSLPGARLANTGSLYTFYPAEGNISLYPSNYGLTYKSSHLNVQAQAPVSWTQSVPRQQRR